MTTYPPTFSPGPQRVKRPISKSAKVLIWLGVVSTVILAFVAIASSAGNHTDTDTGTVPPLLPTTFPSQSKSPSNKPLAKAAKPTAIPDGSWIAGTDFAIGSYEALTQSKGCVWMITKGNGGDFINGASGPGHFIQKFSAGEVLETINCGAWTKRG